MKNKFNFFCIISLALISCNGNNEISDPVESISNANGKAIDKKEMSMIKKESEAMFEKLNNSIFQNIKTTTVNTSFPSSGNTSSITSQDPPMEAQNIFGPYTIEVGINGPIATNQAIIFNDGTNYPPIGVYYADVYRYFLKVEIPANSVGIVDTVYPVGYSNYSNQTSGFTYGMAVENGKNYLYANTYTLHLKYNAAGQYLGNLFRPMNPSAIRFTYRYLKF
ncbi:MAG TPA: hypothetical protein DD740_06790 [Chryseobacterium sp.]|nr:hypothetical protein [Epilithonimonas bovis]HBR11899.1 hypothetical protein [Chryseobacterium sp.]